MDIYSKNYLICLELEKQRKEKENYENAEEAFGKLDIDGNGM